MTTTRAIARVAAAVAVVAMACGAVSARAPHMTAGSFVTRTGKHLTLGGRPFRFGGANIEWLGVVGYGPADPRGPHFPSNYEIDDAMATASQLGATVVRSQTMGDSVGCDACIEPTLGSFNDAAFERVDYALASARAHGLRIIATIVGDDALEGGTGCVYLRWRGITQPDCSLLDLGPFWTNQAVIGDVEAHIAALLNHVNVYTHVAYKNDPTILGWDLLNGGGSPTGWTREVAGFTRSIDARHLILSGYANAGLAAVDACVSFIYPHWSMPLAFVKPWIAACARKGKPYLAYEYGWDRTNYPTLRALRTFLDTLRRMPAIAGDAFWALQAHSTGHGWMPLPADTTDPDVALHGESGQWWALYYPGVETLVSTAADMTARAEAIRRHNFAMRRVPVPPHRVPTAPTVTSIRYEPATGSVRVYWQGSPGARSYSVQRGAHAGGPWIIVCRRCVTDTADGYADVTRSAWYRVIPYNVDGKQGRASKPRQAPAG